MAIGTSGKLAPLPRGLLIAHANDAPADNSGVLKRFLAQELPESGDVEADEAASALPDNAVLEEAAFVLACVVAGDASDWLFSRPCWGRNRTED